MPVTAWRSQCAVCRQAETRWRPEWCTWIVLSNAEEAWLGLHLSLDYILWRISTLHVRSQCRSDGRMQRSGCLTAGGWPTWQSQPPRYSRSAAAAAAAGLASPGAVRTKWTQRDPHQTNKPCFQGSACSAPAWPLGWSSRCWRTKASPSKRCGAGRRRRRRSWLRRWTYRFTPTGSTTCCCTRTWIWSASTCRRLWRGRSQSKHWVSPAAAAAAGRRDGWMDAAALLRWGLITGGASWQTAHRASGTFTSQLYCTVVSLQ